MPDDSAIALLDALLDPAILLDNERRVVAANEAARRAFGGLAVGDNLALSIRNPDVLDAVNAVLAGAPTADATIIQTLPVSQVFEMHIAAIDAVGAGAFCLLRDVTGAREAERMRADFVANVSHELRSPLSSLVGFLETLQGPARDDAEARTRFLEIMEAEAQRMARLVDDLLSLSRVEASEHVRPSGVVDISAVLSQVIDSVSDRASRKGTEIVVQTPGEVPDIPGDRDELSEVFHNLVDNAVKYGAAGTPVNITLNPRQRIPDIGDWGMAVAVNNQGEAIAAEHLPRLTERFYRIDKGRSRDMGGTGLGLAIVKHIVAHHRGRLTIESSEETGNTFTVFLPLQA